MNFKKTRVLVLLSDVASSPQLVSIMRELTEQGADLKVILIASGKSAILIQLQKLNLKIKVLPAKSKVLSLIYIFNISYSMIGFWPKVVFASGLYATILGMISSKLTLRRRRIFIRHHSSLHHDFKLRLGLLMDYLSNLMATDIVAVSSVVETVLIEVESVPKDKITTILNGVDLEKFKVKTTPNDALICSTKSAKKAITIGVVSRLTHWKGVEYVAKAFVRFTKVHPNSFLHIVGSFADSYESVLKELAPIGSDKFLLEESVASIPHFMGEIDVFIHVPIGQNEEAFGLVYVEAMASGVSCIFTVSGVLNSLPNPDVYFYLAQYRSEDSIYKALLEIAENQNKKKPTVPESWLRQFSLDRMAKSYTNLILREK